MSNLYGINAKIGPSGVALVPGPPGPPGPAGSSAGAYSIVTVTGPQTVAAAAATEYACDVTSGAIVINLPTLTLGQVVLVVHVAGALGTHSITVNSPGGGVLLGQPAPNNGTNVASLVFNNSADAGFAFSWTNYGISNLYNIK